jgi:hypothetical protein
MKALIIYIVLAVGVLIAVFANFKAISRNRKLRDEYTRREVDRLNRMAKPGN